MGRIVVTEYVSLDGVVEAPSGTENFERVGWIEAAANPALVYDAEMAGDFAIPVDQRGRA